MRMLSMNAREPLRTIAASMAASLVFAASVEARGQACPTTPPIVYVNGGGKVIIENLAKVLSSSGVTVIYKQQGSCLALDSIVNGTKMTGAATYWNATDAVPCDLDVAGVIADIGISDVFPTTCANL